MLESQPTMDRVINWFVSLASCLVIKINPILERFTGHKFNVDTNSCVEEITIDGEMLLRVAGVIGLVVAAFVVVRWLCKVIFRCCCKRRKTMKAPGRNYRILRNDFERDPADYFRNLRK
ncbi:hypothetical protein E2542_SST25279 [Spatholobus suberectus]|nr:hypothetical protein E2542_SST25279 [Spatholobus suberectus]